VFSVQSLGSKGLIGKVLTTLVLEPHATYFSSNRLLTRLEGS